HQYGGYADNEYDEDQIQGRQYNAIFNDQPQQTYVPDSMDAALTQADQENDGGLYPSERDGNVESFNSDPSNAEEGSDAQYVASLKSQKFQMSPQGDIEASYDSQLRSYQKERERDYKAQQEYLKSLHHNPDSLSAQLQRDYKAQQEYLKSLHHNPESLLAQLQGAGERDEQDFKVRLENSKRPPHRVDFDQGASALPYGAYPHVGEEQNGHDEQPGVDAYDFSPGQSGFGF
ncbi:hypothetical protein MIR68_002539, partial [Amoeboaphelidium protococcarum]